jgi:hypothetical protein
MSIERFDISSRVRSVHHEHGVITRTCVPETPPENVDDFVF